MESPAGEPADRSALINVLVDQQSVLIPAYKKGYSLLYGPTNFYVLVKLIATIYERLAKAHELISQTAKTQMA
jgi:hypothetical protein